MSGDYGIGNDNFKLGMNNVSNQSVGVYGKFKDATLGCTAFPSNNIATVNASYTFNPTSNTSLTPSAWQNFSTYQKPSLPGFGIGFGFKF